MLCSPSSLFQVSPSVRSLPECHQHKGSVSSLECRMEWHTTFSVLWRLLMKCTRLSGELLPLDIHIWDYLAGSCLNIMEPRTDIFCTSFYFTSSVQFVHGLSASYFLTIASRLFNSLLPDPSLVGSRVLPGPLVSPFCTFSLDDLSHALGFNHLHATKS